MTSHSGAIIAFPQRRPAEPDAQLIAHAKRRAWLAVSNLPFPTKLLTAGTPYLETAPLTIAIWWRLRVRLWMRGPIADDPRELAEAARVPLRTWRSKAEDVEHFFDRTATGAWFDPDLEEARQSALAKEERRELQRLRRLQSTAAIPSTGFSA